MITVISGMIYYRMVTQYKDDYKVELMKFLGVKGFAKNELDAVNNFDFTMRESKLKIKRDNDFELNIKVDNDGSIVLLFATKMDSDEFAKFIAGYFS